MASPDAQSSARPSSIGPVLRSFRLRLALTWGIVGVFTLGGHTWLGSSAVDAASIACFIVLFATIVYAASGVVHEAEHLARALGEPYGTLILTLSIVCIEVILIAAVMMGPAESATIGRDSIFAVMMIIMNLVMGLCLLLGGMRYSDQEYNAQGSIAYVSMIALLTGLGLVLPNYVSSGTGSFLPIQAISIAVFTIVLYGAFLAMQMQGYRRLFIQPAAGSLSVPARTASKALPQASGGDAAGALDRRAIVVRSVVLVALVLPIVLLAHDLAILIDLGIDQAGAPVAVGGVLIAIIVFTPESITAVKAARANEMQRSVNLCLGAFVSTVGLTVPAVLTIGLVKGKTVTLGLGPLETVLLLITIALSLLTFVGQRTSSVQGIMHLMLFAMYSVLLFAP